MGMLTFVGGTIANAPAFMRLQHVINVFLIMAVQQRAMRALVFNECILCNKRHVHRLLIDG